MHGRAGAGRMLVFRTLLFLEYVGALGSLAISFSTSLITVVSVLAVLWSWTSWELLKLELVGNNFALDSPTHVAPEPSMASAWAVAVSAASRTDWLIFATSSGFVMLSASPAMRKSGTWRLPQSSRDSRPPTSLESGPAATRGNSPQAILRHTAVRLCALYLSCSLFVSMSASAPTKRLRWCFPVHPVYPTFAIG